VANLKNIRKRITSVKSTQKITRAMKMVAGARLHRAQQRIVALRPYAVKTAEVMQGVVAVQHAHGRVDATHPLLARREVKNVLLLVVTSDRGLCGSFNANINKRAEIAWREAEAKGIGVQIATVGRKGRDYFRRRNAPVVHNFEEVWDDLGIHQTRKIARRVLTPFVSGEVDAVEIVYNEFKSAMTQTVSHSALFPLPLSDDLVLRAAEMGEPLFEPDQDALLKQLVPRYVEITLLRALYESMASELGARMTAMDAATKNAKEMISALTLQYNRVRQAAITTEILEIIGGAEALNA
jgi:F-type H+-transporting ATPase subunit gamma